MHAAKQKEFDTVQAQLQAAGEVLAQKKQALDRAEAAYQVKKTAAELSDYIRLGQRVSGKTLTLTALGILVGFGLGNLLYDYILPSCRRMRSCSTPLLVGMPL
ncbi:MAG: hypothetical protein V8S89_03290 [Oscillospiraceae bacterium]